MSLLILSSAYLFNVSEKKQALDINKNWWVASFENPTDNSLDFTIENYTANNNFSWEVFSKKDRLDSGIETIDSGKSKKIHYTTNTQAGDQIIIRITANQESKELYKNIN